MPLRRTGSGSFPTWRRAPNGSDRSKEPRPGFEQGLSRPFPNRGGGRCKPRTGSPTKHPQQKSRYGALEVARSYPRLGRWAGPRAVRRTKRRCPSPGEGYDHWESTWQSGFSRGMGQRRTETISRCHRHCLCSRKEERPIAWGPAFPITRQDLQGAINQGLFSRGGEIGLLDGEGYSNA